MTTTTSTSTSTFKGKKEEKGLEKLATGLRAEQLKSFKKNKYIQNNFEWFSYSRYYLRAAQILLDAASSHEEEKYLVVPALFNLRHGLELVLKASIRFLSDEDSDPPENVHDINKIFSKLKKKITSSQKKGIAKFAKEIGDPQADAEKFFKNSIDDLSNMVTKYYYQIPATKVLERDQYFIEDIENELFKYPESNKIKFGLKSKSFIDGLDDTNMKEFNRDLYRIRTGLNVVFLSFGD